MNKIIFDNNILSGKPIIRGTRISVEFILDLIASGMSIEEILKEYKQLTKEDILSAIEYASKSLKKEEIIFTDKNEIAA
ncbi:DUF433 domain-containing protein [archaeon]|jgi:uncharacterized protein (DUF433 family)|nr:DUF433 domain-containing protein [archaeon]MBT4351515.1 DUF433 domain-containing protein [archaeon]MBT4648636.1 DUF433 domain-containing protein [archaeon]MBT6822501.1 DUF433 domain-containing protein [archaeon]MBT7392175.1 DUF433 domain-containing protein [archaeon]